MSEETVPADTVAAAQTGPVYAWADEATEEFSPAEERRWRPGDGWVAAAVITALAIAGTFVAIFAVEHAPAPPARHYGSIAEAPVEQVPTPPTPPRDLHEVGPPPKPVAAPKPAAPPKPRPPVQQPVQQPLTFPPNAEQQFAAALQRQDGMGLSDPQAADHQARQLCQQIADNGKSAIDVWGYTPPSRRVRS
jgi:hypothetical protein